MLYNQALFSDCVIPTDEKNPLIPINVCRTRMHIGCRGFFIHYTNAKCVNISNSNRLITRVSRITVDSLMASVYIYSVYPPDSFTCTMS